RLTGTRRPEHHRHFPRRQVQRHVTPDGLLAEGLGQALDDHLGTHRTLLERFRGRGPSAGACVSRGSTARSAASSFYEQRPTPAQVTHWFTPECRTRGNPEHRPCDVDLQGNPRPIPDTRSTPSNVRNRHAAYTKQAHPPIPGYEKSGRTSRGCPPAFAVNQAPERGVRSLERDLAAGLLELGLGGLGGLLVDL